MGQQQLLLLVLGIVIVGLAVVVGIQAFGENQKKANADAMVNDAVRIASDAQAFSLKPAAFGGGALNSATFTKLGYTASGSGNSAVYTNLNTTTDAGNGYTMAASGKGVLITGTSPNNVVHARVCGTTPSDITTVVNGTAPAACA